MALTEIGARLRLAGAPAFSKDARRGSDSLDRMGRSARNADRDVSRLERTAKRARSSMGGKAGALFGAAIGGGAIVGIKSALDAASNLNETVSKSRAVFGKASAAVESFGSDSKRNILLTKQAAIEGAASFGNLFVAMGVGQRPAAGLSTKLTALASDLSSFNNVDTDEALLALRSGLLGEAEPLRKFGVQLSAARVEAEAYSLGLVKPVKDAGKIRAAQNAIEAASGRVAAAQKKYGVQSLQARQATDGLERAQGGLAKAMKGQKVDLTAAQKAQAAYSIIMKDTKTAQGDAARTAGGYANATRILQKKIAESRAEIGQKLLPVAERATKRFSELIDEFKAGSGTGGQLRDVAEGLGQKLKEAGEFGQKYIVPPLRWMSEHPDAMKAIVEAMVAYKAAVWLAAGGQKSLATWMALTGQSSLPGVAGAPGGGKKPPGKPGGKMPLIGGNAATLAGVVVAEGGRYIDPKLPKKLQSWDNEAPGVGKAYKASDGKWYPTKGLSPDAPRRLFHDDVPTRPKAAAPRRLFQDDVPTRASMPVRTPRVTRSGRATAAAPAGSTTVNTIAPVIHMHGYNGSKEDIKKIAAGVMDELDHAAARK